MVMACCLGMLLCCNTCVLFRKKKDIYNSINYPTDDNSDKKVKNKSTKIKINSANNELETSRRLKKNKY